MRNKLLAHSLKVLAYLTSAVLTAALSMVFGKFWATMVITNSMLSLPAFVGGYITSTNPRRADLSFKNNLMLMTVYHALTVPALGYFYLNGLHIDYLFLILFVDFGIAFVIYKLGMIYIFRKR